MEQHKKAKNIDTVTIDFVDKADNVYRTREYIVKQQISTSVNKNSLITHLISEDTYYLRTPKRDVEYNIIFKVRGKNIDGKRIRSTMYTRKHVD